jgi:hypothetical protein
VNSSFIESLSIVEVWYALGGGEIRHKRGRARWRNGDGWSVSLNNDKNVWFDFVANQGGGILSLVQVALGCDRKTAFQWLADFAGVTLERLTPEEGRDYARRRNAAEAEAAALVEWHTQMVNALVEHRNLALGLYHADKCSILRGDYETDTELDLLMDEAEQVEEAYERDDTALDVWHNASWDDLLVLFRERRHECE